LGDVALTDLLSLPTRRSSDLFRPQVLDLSAQRGSGAGIDTERSRSLWLMMQQVPGDLIEQYLRIGRGGRSRTERSAAGQGEGSRACAKPGDHLAAAEGFFCNRHRGL